MKTSALAATVVAAFLVAGAPAFGASASTPPSTADGSVTWSVTPADADGGDGRAWVESELDPGDEITEYLAVRNLGEDPATFDLVSADGYFTATGRFNMLQAGQPSTGAGTWITVQDRVSVKPGVTAVVPFTITVPQNATPGDHAAGIAASVSTSGTTADGAQIGVDSRVGFRVMTRVAGELAPALTVSALSSEVTPSWNLFAPGSVELSYTVTNAGNTQLTVTETTGTTTTERGDLFPGESREVTGEPIPVWPIGPQTMAVTIAGSVPGDAALSAEPVTTSTTFWLVPWVHLAILGGIAAVIIAAILTRRRNAAKISLLLEEARAQGRREAVQQ